MSIDFLLQALTAILSLVTGGIASTDVIRRVIRVILKIEEPEKSYSERLGKLTENLSQASREVDEILSELSRVAKERASTVQQLEIDLATMEGREKELRETIDALEKTPLPVAEHFAKLVAPGEKKSAVRDYLLFGAGVLVSSIIGLAIQVLVN